MGKNTKVKRKPSAYNKHIGREMRAGKTMKQAAASWKRKGSKPKSKSAGKSRSTSRSSSKSGGRRLGKNTFNTQKIFSLLRKGALIAPAAAVAMDPSLSAEEKVRVGVQKYTGVDMRTGQFHLNSLKEGWYPYLATTAVTTVAQKLGSFIRGIF